ncbi:MAG: hypothetical protein RBT20_05805 [Syntrophales bacterium]|jgi:hypothetical protein|nr:hypothetical protein [Syntrophales bacterium]
MSFTKAILILLFIACSQAMPQAWAAGPSEKEMDDVLACAETMFNAQKARQYSDIWNCLTKKTKRSIVEAVQGQSKRTGSGLAESAIEADFAAGRAVAKAYWDGYLQVFRPDMVLEESQWSIGEIGKDKAEIVILYRKSERPAVLRMFKEGGGWKVGLDETFGARGLLATFQ